jgi:hypothetical protein
MEHGFSINKQVEQYNMSSATVVAHRLICDHVVHVGGITNVQLTKGLMNSCSQARTRYRMHLEDQRKKKEGEEMERKRKAEEALKLESAKKRKTLEAVIGSLEEDMLKHLGAAESAGSTKMA